MRTLQIGEKVLVKRDAFKEEDCLISVTGEMLLSKGLVRTITEIRPFIYDPESKYVFRLDDHWFYLRRWIIPMSDVTIDDLI